MLKRFLVLLISFVSLAASAESSKNLEGIVVTVTSGDSLILVDRNKERHQINLIAVKSPEKKDQLREKSKKSLSSMVLQKEVQIEWTRRDPECSRSRPKQLETCAKIGRVSLHGKDINQQQLYLGMVKFHDPATTMHPEDRDRYLMAESEAKAHRLGIWSGTFRAKEEKKQKKSKKGDGNR